MSRKSLSPELKQKIIVAYERLLKEEYSAYEKKHFYLPKKMAIYSKLSEQFGLPQRKIRTTLAGNTLFIERKQQIAKARDKYIVAELNKGTSHERLSEITGLYVSTLKTLFSLNKGNWSRISAIREKKAVSKKKASVVAHGKPTRSHNAVLKGNQIYCKMKLLKKRKW